MSSFEDFLKKFLMMKYVKEHSNEATAIALNNLFIKYPDLDDFVEYSNFVIAPASTKYHGSYESGLLEHSVNVMNTLCELTENNHLSWKRPESPIIVGLFHDICKADMYVKRTSDDLSYECNNDTLLKGHGEKSVMMLASLMQLTEEEVACIRYHMGAFTNKEEWNDYTRAIHIYPNVLWTHHADMIATHIMEVEDDY